MIRMQPFGSGSVRGLQLAPVGRSLANSRSTGVRTFALLAPNVHAAGFLSRLQGQVNIIYLVCVHSGSLPKQAENFISVLK